MDIRIINNETEDFSGRLIDWEGHRVGFTNCGFEDVLSNLWGPVERLRVNRPALEGLIDSITGADAVFCETPEALICHTVMTRRAIPCPAFVVEDEDIFRSAIRLDGWLESIYEERFLEGFLADRHTVVLHHAASQRGEYLMHIADPQRLMFMPCSSYYLTMIEPEIQKKIALHMTKGENAADWGEVHETFRGTVLSAGINQRDYATFAAALDIAGLHGHIISHSIEESLRNHPRIRWHGFMPIAGFVAALAAASVVVVPMKAKDHSGGENTATFAMALGKPVIITRTPSSEEFITHGADGILAAPGDAPSLAEAITLLVQSPALRESIGAAAAARERAISDVSRATLLKAFALATRLS